MVYSKFSILVAGIIAITACQKNIPGNTESDYSFDASVASSTVSGTDSANFLFTENPDIISFYSGETGRNYEYKDRTILSGGALKVKFESRVVNKVADTLEVLLSNDFSGVYDSANVAKANWKKITTKFLYPVAATVLGTFIPSGATFAQFTEITDQVTPGTPFYFAFRYDVNKQTNIEWSIGKLAMYNLFSNGIPNATVIDSNTNNSGSFATVRFGDPTTRWSKTSTLYKCALATTAPLGAQHWYISRPLNPSAVAPDLPIVIKNISQSQLAAFKYKYSAPGTYKAVFVASYIRKNFEKTFVKEVLITVQ